MADSKFCRKCSKDKDIGEFSRSRARKDGHGTWCKQCMSLYRRENRDRMNTYNAKYKKTPGGSAANRRHTQRHRAVVGGLPSTLTENEWQDTLDFWFHQCAYCGSEEKLTQDHTIPSSKGGGYTKENIVPACGSCNSSKHNRSLRDWLPNPRI